MFKALTITGAALLLSVFKVSLFSLLPFPASTIDPLLIALVLILFIFNLKLALGLALLSGLVLELFSAVPFGVLSGSLALATVSAQALARNLFTNRSLPALLSIGLSSTLIYRAALLNFHIIVALKLKSPLTLALKSYLWGSALQVLFNSAVLALAYLIIYKSSKKLQSSFV